MLEIKRLNELFSLLEKMTKTSYPEFVPSPKIQRLQKWVIYGFLFTLFMFLALAAWHHFVGTVHPGFYYPLVIVPLIPLSLVTKMSVGLALDSRRQASSVVLAALKEDLHCDAELIAQLWTFDKATLAYGLIQYRHRWSSFERRLALLAQKPGLLGVAVILMSLFAALLLEEKDRHLLLWSIGIGAVILYVGMFKAFVSLERPKQVIQLLEYTIQHADKPHP